MTLEQTPEAMDRLEKKVDQLLGIAHSLRIGPATVAELFVGRSLRWCQDRPWSLPPQDAANPSRWTLAEVIDYYSVPLEIREEQWRSKMRRSA